MKENPTELIDQFLDHARKSGAIDDLRSSAFVLAFDVERADLRMALQIGCALVYDKPLLLIEKHGERIPERLRMFADEIVTLEPGGLEHPTNQAKLTAAIVRMTERVAAKERRDGK